MPCCMYVLVINGLAACLGHNWLKFINNLNIITNEKIYFINRIVVHNNRCNGAGGLHTD